ncbi:hypothetical protein HDV57DRAFT_496372 [Trichoderma longibrachiatum]
MSPSHPTYLTLPPYLHPDQCFSCVCARGKAVYLYPGTGGPRSSAPAPICELEEWTDRGMEHASLQTCNAALVCAHMKTHASGAAFALARARVCTRVVRQLEEGCCMKRCEAMQQPLLAYYGALGTWPQTGAMQQAMAAMTAEGAPRCCDGTAQLRSRSMAAVGRGANSSFPACIASDWIDCVAKFGSTIQGYSEKLGFSSVLSVPLPV